MRKALSALLITALVAFSPASAQSPGFPSTMPPSTVYGRSAISAGPGQAIPFATLTGIMGSTPNVWSALQTYTAGITSTHSLSGSATLGNWNNFTVTEDTQGCHFCTDINSVWDYGGATQRGGRVNIFGWNIQTAPNTGVGQTTVGLGVEGIGQTNTGDGGGSGTEAGTYFGGNFIGACTLFVYACTGAEVDLRTDAAYRGHYTLGVPVVNVEAHQATGLDAAFVVYSGGFEPAAGGGGPWGPGVGFHYGLAFGELGNNGQVPIDSTGTLIGGYVESLSVLPVGYGFDGNLFSFANYFLRCCNLSNLFTVDGSGNTTLGATLNFTNGTNINNQMAANPAGGVDVGTEIRILDNGLAGVKVGAGFISAAGTGYGNTLTGTLTWSGAGCSVNPVLNATSNSGGGIASYSVATAGVCAFQSFPGANATTWTRGGGLSAGTGFSVALDPVILNIFGCHHEDPSALCYVSDSGQTGAFQLFNITTGGGMCWGPGNAGTDVCYVRSGVGAMQINGKLTLTTMTATAVAPTVSAGQIGYGSTTVAAGSGTCPTGTVGGSAVAGCIVVNVAGTARNVPFF